ncbi:Uncharacterised protein [Staphylococcus gallinarum]|uniref:Uncharacterized protein n=1 Tax=Staphylococcus gallinarum TaxID=1293 RepID=A0A380FK62_STAGA|nr:Uncharacterised protein [Staphylococcus gallinarum]
MHLKDHQVDESTNKTVMDKVYKIRSQNHSNKAYYFIQ